MAPLPTNNTSRWFLDYLSSNQLAGQEHTATLRLSTDDDAAAANAKFLQILQAIGASSFRVGWRPLRLRYQAANTLFSLPVPMSSGLAAFVGTASSAGYAAVQETIQYTWAARSTTTGRRARFGLFICPASGLSALRFTSAPWGTTVITALNDTTNAGVIAIDGTPVSFYAYMNVNANSYWERALRA